MDDGQSLSSGGEPGSPIGTAAEAFAHLAARVAALEERLDGRLAVMARALEHVAAETQAAVIPDYSITLAKISKSLTAMEGKPAMQMTPEDVAARMEMAAAVARRDDRAMLSEVKRTLAEVLKDLVAMIGTAASIDAENRRLRWGVGTGFMVGCLIWAILPGVVAHVAPTGWHWPEGIAARTLREPTLWKAGEHLMRADDEKSWDELMSAADVWRGNRDTIMGCRKVAKAGRTARCVIRVRA